MSGCDNHKRKGTAWKKSKLLGLIRFMKSATSKDIDIQRQEFRVFGKGNTERIVYINDNALRWLENIMIGE